MWGTGYTYNPTGPLGNTGEHRSFGSFMLCCSHSPDSLSFTFRQDRCWWQGRQNFRGCYHTCEVKCPPHGLEHNMSRSHLPLENLQLPWFRFPLKASDSLTGIQLDQWPHLRVDSYVPEQIPGPGPEDKSCWNVRLNHKLRRVQCTPLWSGFLPIPIIFPFSPPPFCKISCIPDWARTQVYKAKNDSEHLILLSSPTNC